MVWCRHGWAARSYGAWLCRHEHSNRPADKPRAVPSSPAGGTTAAELRRNCHRCVLLLSAHLTNTSMRCCCIRRVEGMPHDCSWAGCIDVLHTWALTSAVFCTRIVHGGRYAGYDGRHNSKSFAHTAAAVFLSQGVRVHMFKDMVRGDSPALPVCLRPTCVSCLPDPQHCLGC